MIIQLHMITINYLFQSKRAKTRFDTLMNNPHFAHKFLKANSTRRELSLLISRLFWQMVLGN